MQWDTSSEYAKFNAVYDPTDDLRVTMSNTPEWTTEAEARLKEIPFFVRPSARKKIEKFAQEMGATQITVEVYEQAKQKFGS
jgi:hypothetical protein